MTEEYIIRSGAKRKTPQGFNAIKDGIKKNAAPEPNAEPKPPWLKVRLQHDPKYEAVKDTVKQHKLSTVCEEAKCPNINECWSAGTATIMIMGDVCTRACRFCAVDTGNPRGWLDENEPQSCAEAVQLMDLKYIVLTSVDRDDIPDGGAQHYADCVTAIIKDNPKTAVEVLTPDFQGKLEAVDLLHDAGIRVFAQNVETVKRLTHPVRDPRASYEQTLALLAYSKKAKPTILTKTSLMLGLGETKEEVLECMDDLRAIGVDIVTFGQYLRPTPNHLPVQHYLSPKEFDEFRKIGLEKGFLEVVSGPLVRSSYRAEKVLEKNNVGL